MTQLEVINMIGRQISPGSAEGEAIVTSEPIGFYGGVDAKTGIIIDKGHELEGQCITDKILVFKTTHFIKLASFRIYSVYLIWEYPHVKSSLDCIDLQIEITQEVAQV